MARSFEPVQLGSIEIFCKAAELAGFTAAAEALGITPAAVSRSIARLENRLGVKLFVRSTRQIRLTDDGAAYKQQCQQALDQIAEAERAIAGHQQVPSGVLRVSLPTTYAHYRVLPRLPAFSLRYPKVTLELNISNRNVDFFDEGYDLAIRMGEPEDSRLIARRLEDASLGVFASPDYLRRRGTPKTPADLRKHDCIQFVRPSTGRAMNWIFREGGEDQEFAFTSKWRVHEDVLGCLGWARAGGGLCQMYHFIAGEAVRRGELVEVLKGWRGRTRPFSVVYPQNRHMSAKVRAFVEFVLASVRTT
ncbi:MAG: LysR family transcriptional regulator [Aquabacterium sp.]|nr:MAG: LysR family transcriptional regulator [Aquabacterium sp.]